MTKNTPYHNGELTVQQRVDQLSKAQASARAISNQIPVGALTFIEQRQMVVIASMDTQGRVWASTVFGQPGFVHAQDSRTLMFETSTLSILKDERLWENLKTHSNIGLLAIDFGSRRRLRVNGSMLINNENKFIINVKQAYANCPKYIQRRHLHFTNSMRRVRLVSIECGNTITSAHKLLIANADTFFVASGHPDHGLDASHRGGNPGFVQIVSDTRLRIPDYVGNSMYNTLGNITHNPQVGLTFLDFQQNILLQLTGKARILWPHNTGGENTINELLYWELEIEAWQETTLPFIIETELLEYSPFNPQ